MKVYLPILALLVLALFVPLGGGESGAAEPGPPLEVSGHPDSIDKPEVEARLARILDSADHAKPVSEKPDEPSVEQASKRTRDRSEVDPEWLTIPRSRRNPEGWLLDARDEKVDTTTMFRHVLLNPNDVYIPKQRRDQLGPSLKELVSQYALLCKLEWKYQESQLRLLVELGKIKPRSRKPTKRRIALVVTGAEASLKSIRKQIENGRAETPDVRRYIEDLEDQIQNPEKYAHQIVGGKANVASLHDKNGDTYELDVRRLPGQKALTEGREYLRLEILGRLVTWFQLQSTLSESQAEKLISRLCSPKKKKE